MSSTGEVACFGRDYDEALLKSIVSANPSFDFNKKSVLLSLGGAVNKAKFLEASQELSALGYTIYATGGTADFFETQGVSCSKIGKVTVREPSDRRMTATEHSPNTLEVIDGKKIAFVVNLSVGTGKAQGGDGFRIRRATVDNQIPLFTDLHLARAFVKSLTHYSQDELEIKSYKEYLN
jgi:carbamoyl-phosphate synthase large subunit